MKKKSKQKMCDQLCELLTQGGQHLNLNLKKKTHTHKWAFGIFKTKQN